MDKLGEDCPCREDAFSPHLSFKCCFVFVVVVVVCCVSVFFCPYHFLFEGNILRLGRSGERSRKYPLVTSTEHLTVFQVFLYLTFTKTL